MKRMFVLFISIFFTILSAEDYSNYSYSKLINLLEIDSLNTLEIKETIIINYPESEATWGFAHEEFYDKIYPIWRDEKAQIPVLDSLLIKYPQTSFKRNIYLYQCYNLKKTNSKDSLNVVLERYRDDFPFDYQSYYLSARFYSVVDSVSKESLSEESLLEENLLEENLLEESLLENFAKKALSLTNDRNKDFWEPPYF